LRAIAEREQLDYVAGGRQLLSLGILPAEKGLKY
jgi:hypothetical protein